MVGSRPPRDRGGMRFRSLTLLPLLAAAAFAAPAGATTFCVHQSGTCPAGTTDVGGDLQKALDSAPGQQEVDIIDVGPGTYTGPFVYPSSGAVDIVGAGRGQTTLTDPDVASPDSILTLGGHARVSRLRIHLSPAPFWNGVLAFNEGNLVRNVTVDAAPGSSRRVGVSLLEGASIDRSTIALDDNDTGIVTASKGRVDAITDTIVTAGTGVTTHEEDDGRTVVRRSTISAFTPLIVQGASLQATNTVLHGRPNTETAIAVTCDKGKPGDFAGDHLTIDGNGTHAGVFAQCKSDGSTATAEFTNSVIAHTATAFTRVGSKDGSASVAFAFSDLRASTGEQVGAGTVTLHDNLDVAPGFAADGLHLAPGSPLVDAGEPGPPAAAQDRDGNPRLVGERQDIGAFELPEQPRVDPPLEFDKPGTPAPPPQDVVVEPATIGSAGSGAGGSGAGSGPLARDEVSDAALLAELRRTIARKAGRRGVRYAHRFLVPGTVTIRWIAKRSGRTIVVARGKLARTTLGVAKLRVKPTKRGRRLLRGGRRVKIVVRASFAPTGRTLIRASRRTALRAAGRVR
jgi:hypothetical protein